MKTVYAPLIVCVTAESWDYAWPYGENNTCICREVPAVGEFFESQEECLKAYSEDKYQWCYYGDTGVSDAQCDDAVTIAEGVTNDVCSSKCTNLVAGNLPFEDFESTCKFNFYADFGDEVAVGWTSCFSNLVYGWSDYDPSNPIQEAPLRLFSNVEGATQCQALCQAVEDCVYWTWRAYADEDESAQAFQNPPLTCLLYDQKYIDGVLNTVMPTTDAFAVATPYCNFAEIPECMIDIFGREQVPFLEPYSCLLCGCVGKCAWKSPYHLSGPAFCEPEYRDECSYTRPTWTSTLPPCDSEATATTTTVALDSSEETLTETTIALDDTTTEIVQSDATYPETIGTSMSSSTQMPEDNSSEAVTGGTSTSTISPSDVTASEGISGSILTPATVTPAGTGQSTMPYDSGLTVGTATTADTLTPSTVTPAGTNQDSLTAQTMTPAGTEQVASTPATVTPAGTGETTIPDMSQMTMGTATTSALSPGSENTAAPTVTPPSGATCPDCPEDDCDDDIPEVDFVDDDECIDC